MQKTLNFCTNFIDYVLTTRSEVQSTSTASRDAGAVVVPQCLVKKVSAVVLSVNETVDLNL